MADFIHKRLQVFVSSTYTDLRADRQAAVEAILKAGHIPAGMELFTAGDEAQMDVIKQWIDESDVYYLILGGRYGSIEPKSGKSYVELEYEYAMSKGKPLFASVISEAALKKRVKKEAQDVIEMENPQKLKNFQTLVLSKISRFWDDEKDIKLHVIDKLSELSRRSDLVGWVRASEQANMPAVTNEMARLSKENAQLRDLIASKNGEGSIGGVSFFELKAILEEKGVLDLLVQRRSSLADGMWQNESTETGEKIDHGPNLRELQLIGLVAYNEGRYKFFLTETGRIFLNKFEAERIASKSVK